MAPLIQPAVDLLGFGCLGSIVILVLLLLPGLLMTRMPFEYWRRED